VDRRRSDRARAEEQQREQDHASWAPAIGETAGERASGAEQKQRDGGGA